MGFLDKYRERFPSENIKKSVNIEWVLKTLDWVHTLISDLVSQTLTAALSKSEKSPKFSTELNNTITNSNLILPQINIGEFRIHNGFITSSSESFYCRLPSSGIYNYSLFAASLHRDSGSFKRFRTTNGSNTQGGSNICDIPKNESTYLIIFYTRIS